MDKPDFISRITFTLFGIFITSVIFALSIKIIGQIGIYLSLLACGGISTFIIISYKNSPRLRLISYGMISMITVALILLLASLGILSGLF